MSKRLKKGDVSRVFQFIMTPFVVVMMPFAFAYICFRLAYVTLDIWFKNLYNK